MYIAMSTHGDCITLYLRRTEYNIMMVSMNNQLPIQIQTGVSMSREEIC